VRTAKLCRKRQPTEASGAVSIERVEAPRVGLNPMRAEPHPLVMGRQRLRLASGTFAEIEGIEVRKKGRGHRVVLAPDLPMQKIAIEVDGEDAELVDASVPPTLKEIDKQIKKLAQTPLYQFNCLDSYPKSARVSASSAATR
jgi:hypothetical protein